MKDFKDQNLSGMNFNAYQGDDSVFTGATTIKTVFSHGIFINGIFNRLNPIGGDIDARFLKADLTGANFKGANLRGSDFTGANLTNVNFYNATLHYCNFTDAKMRGAILNRAICNKAIFRHTFLSDASLAGGSFKGADFTRAELNGADLYSADLSGVTGLLDPTEWLNSHCQYTHDGLVCYKRIGNTTFQSPSNWEIKEGMYLTETCNPLRTLTCGCGVNVGTFGWCEHMYTDQDLWECRIEWKDLAGVVVPYNTDGKFRANRVRLVEMVKFGL